MMQFLNLSSLAEQMLIHEHACVAIRKDMPLDRAALIGCGVLTGVCSVFHTANVRPGDTVARSGGDEDGGNAHGAPSTRGCGRFVNDGKMSLARALVHCSMHLWWLGCPNDGQSFPRRLATD